MDDPSARRIERIACVGDSITEGVGVADPAASYPSVLQRLVGDRGLVGNFGHSGATLLSLGDMPYRSTPAFAAATAFAPTIVALMLGTNDSKPWNWAHGAAFGEDLAALVAHFRALPTRPRVLILTPPMVDGENFGIRQRVIADELMPVLIATATRLGAPVVDVHGATLGHPAWFPDRVHPAEPGMRAIAEAVAWALVGNGSTAGRAAR